MTNRPLVSSRMLAYFAGAVVIMLAHKIECWLTAEWLESPFFQAVTTSSLARGNTVEDSFGEAIFITFVVWLFAGLGMGLLLLRGGRGPLIALGIWGLTFILEWHHIARALVAGEYYTGLFTSMAYLPFGFLYWRALVAEFKEHEADQA
jgi:hypothetical protein